jgi:Leucine-rich repeat (LRR) protein
LFQIDLTPPTRRRACDSLELTSLVSLTEGFGELNLTKLVLGKTPLDGAEEAYAILGKIATLTELDLSYSEIKSLPERIGDLTSLTELKLIGCKKLVSLPGGIKAAALRDCV